jgi:hypothetical protein
MDFRPDPASTPIPGGSAVPEPTASCAHGGPALIEANDGACRDAAKQRGLLAIEHPDLCTMSLHRLNYAAGGLPAPSTATPRFDRVELRTGHRAGRSRPPSDDHSTGWAVYQPNGRC